MSSAMIILCSMAVLFTLILLRFPVAIAMLTTALGGSIVISFVQESAMLQPLMMQFKSLFWNLATHYELSLIPLFIMMGHLAYSCKLSDDLFDAMQSLMYGFKARLPLAVIATSAGFGAFCGSSLATTATMSRLAIEPFRKAGYEDVDAASVLVAGGTLGILIPPSVILVIYAIVVEVSVLQLFRAAMIPALLAVCFFSAVIALRFYRTSPAAVHKLRSLALIGKLLPSSVLFLLMIGGIGSGLFTPVPAASVAVCLLLLYGLCRLRGRFGGALAQALLQTARTTAMIYFILFAAEVLKIFLVRVGLPQLVAEIGTSHLSQQPMLLMLLVLLILIALGCVMESLSLVLVVVPFLWPLLATLNGGEFVSAEHAAFGLNHEQLKVWLGILFLIVIELGLITPPLGLNMLITQDIIGSFPMLAYVKAVLPFIVAELLRILLLLWFPPLATMLPNL